MPISISALTANRRTVAIDFGGETLKVTYRPAAINAAQEARELEDKEKGQHVLSMVRSLCETVESWDLLGDDGKPLSITEEALAPLGFAVLARIVREIVRDALPNLTTPPDSNNGSSPRGASASARSGT